MRARPLVLALALAAGGCGETLVDHNGVSVLDSAATCGDGQVVCDGVCVTQSVAACGTSCAVCPSGPANATESCNPVGVGGHDGVCGFQCADGLLRCGAACCAPQLVAAGGSFSCASTTTGEVHCFGAGDVGQLGNGSIGDRATSAVLRGFATPVTALVAGGAHACAISGGQTLCWGNGAAFGASGAVIDPEAVPALAGATAISAGASHTCGIVAGAVVCVGRAADAGGGSPAIGGTALAVATGADFSCALVDAGASGVLVKCWGIDSFGQLGDGIAGATSSTPLQVGVVPTTGVNHLTAGARHACAGVEIPSAKNALWCWGDNRANQLGTAAGTLLGPTLNSRVSKGILDLAAGDHATCAMENDAANVLSCWSSDPGLLVSIPGEPIQIATATGALYDFSAGGAHVCYVDALQTPRRLKCFGANAHGQLGDGNTTGSLAPVLVLDR